MKRAAMVFGVLAVAALVAAQQQQAPAQQKQPAGATGTTQPSSAQSGSAQQGSATAAPPQGKRPPQAKTQAEFDAYNAAIANQKDPAAMEKAADDFATKFPDSELRALLFKAAMRGYQNANNGDKMLEESQKLLKLDPDDPEALIASAEVIAERTRDTDLDKDQRFAQATKYAQHALETIDTDVPIPCECAASPNRCATRGCCDQAHIRFWVRSSTTRKNMLTHRAISRSLSMLIPRSLTL